MRAVGYSVALSLPACEGAQREGVVMAVGSGSIVIPPTYLLEDTNNI